MIPNRRPKVFYKKHTTDVQLQLLLERIAQILGADITVHSGNRDYRPKGSPSKSLHLHHRAADFHAMGLTDEQVFARLKANKSNLSDKNFRYQVIRHGPFTETEAPHIHIGDYTFLFTLAHGSGVAFFVEGLTPEGKGKYVPPELIELQTLVCRCTSNGPETPAVPLSIEQVTSATV